MKKILVTTTFLIAINFTGFSQSEKMTKKINEKIEKINTDIQAGDSSLKLTEAQTKAIFDLEWSSIKAIKKAKKDNASKEDIKELRKSFMKQIYSDVLTKEQKKARRKGKSEQDG